MKGVLVTDVSAGPETATASRIAGIITQGRRVALAATDALGEVGLREETWRILHTLSVGTGLPMSDLAGNLALPAATATRCVDELVGSALVYRTASPEDARQVIACLSRLGAEKLERANAVLDARGILRSE